MAEMTVSEILDALSENRGFFPREAVEAAVADWEEISDEFVAVLERTAEDPEGVADRENYMLHLYAMYLCAEKRDTRALSPVLRILSYPDDRTLERLLSDTLTNAGGRIVASLFDGDIEPIQSLIEKRDAWDFARDQGIHALEILYLHGFIERQTLINYIYALFNGRLEREPSHVWNGLVGAATDLKLTDLVDHIRAAYAEGLVDTLFASEEELVEEIETPEAASRHLSLDNPHLQLINSTVESMHWWAAFEENRKRRPARLPNTSHFPAIHGHPGETFQRSGRKVGRNEPCPCGSGRKYKQCCGR
jgi:uncharacterized protein YchJ